MSQKCPRDQAHRAAEPVEDPTVLHDDGRTHEREERVEDQPRDDQQEQGHDRAQRQQHVGADEAPVRERAQHLAERPARMAALLLADDPVEQACEERGPERRDARDRPGAAPGGRGNRPALSPTTSKSTSIPALIPNTTSAAPGDEPEAVPVVHGRCSRAPRRTPSRGKLVRVGASPPPQPRFGPSTRWRRPLVEYRQLGSTGIRVSELCLGTMTFGNEADEATSRELVDRFLDAGGNFVDTADVYTDGASEEITGRALRGRRDDIVLATKVRFPTGDGVNDVGASRRPHPHGHRGVVAPPRDGVGRPLPDPLLGPAHAARGDAVDARRPRPRGQDPLRRREQLHGVAAREVARPRRAGTGWEGSSRSSPSTR